MYALNLYGAYSGPLQVVHYYINQLWYTLYLYIYIYTSKGISCCFKHDIIEIQTTC